MIGLHRLNNLHSLAKKVLEEGAMRAHPEIFTESARKFEGEAFEKALSRWARKFPEEAAAYEDSIGEGGTLPMENPRSLGCHRGDGEETSGDGYCRGGL